MSVWRWRGGHSPITEPVSTSSAANRSWCRCAVAVDHRPGTARLRPRLRRRVIQRLDLLGGSVIGAAIAVGCAIILRAPVGDWVSHVAGSGVLTPGALGGRARLE